MKIKEIIFGFENCETVIIPYKCFDKFKYTISDDNKRIKTLECIIKDRGETRYSMSFEINSTSPIQRLGKYNDITSIDIVYGNKNTESYYISWYDDNPNYNKNQINNSNNYDEIHIKIEQYIPQYTIYDIFQFPEGTKFKASNGKVFKIESDDDGKYIFNEILTQENITMKYTLVN